MRKPKDCGSGKSPVGYWFLPPSGWALFGTVWESILGNGLVAWEGDFESTLSWSLLCTCSYSRGDRDRWTVRHHERWGCVLLNWCFCSRVCWIIFPGGGRGSGAHCITALASMCESSAVQNTVKVRKRAGLVMLLCCTADSNKQISSPSIMIESLWVH